MIKVYFHKVVGCIFTLELCDDNKCNLSLKYRMRFNNYDDSIIISHYRAATLKLDSVLIGEV